MAIIKIAVQNNRAALLGSIDLITGAVGQKCKFYFDEEWRALPNKKIVYKLGSTIVANEELTGDETIIPPQALAVAGLRLSIGITGFNENRTIVMPTSWCELGRVKNGAIINHKSNSDNDGPDHIIYDGGVEA